MFSVLTFILAFVPRRLTTSLRAPGIRLRRPAGPGAGVAAGAPAANGLGDSWQRGANNLHDFIFWRIPKGEDHQKKTGSETLPQNV